MVFTFIFTIYILTYNKEKRISWLLKDLENEKSLPQPDILRIFHEDQLNLSDYFQLPALISTHAYIHTFLSFIIFTPMNLNTKYLQNCRTISTCLFTHRYIQQCSIQTSFVFFLNGFGAQKMDSKKCLQHFFPGRFMEKLNEMVYKYFSIKNLFKRHEYAMLPQGHQISNIFGPFAHTKRGLHVLLNYPYINIKKMVYPKNVWIRHYLGKGGQRFFTRGRDQRKDDW